MNKFKKICKIALIFLICAEYATFLYNSMVYVLIMYQNSLPLCKDAFTISLYPSCKFNIHDGQRIASIDRLCTDFNQIYHATGFITLNTFYFGMLLAAHIIDCNKKYIICAVMIHAQLVLYLCYCLYSVSCYDGKECALVGNTCESAKYNHSLIYLELKYAVIMYIQSRIYYLI